MPDSLTFRSLSRAIFDCRDCRSDDRFAREIDRPDRPPEIVHGPIRPDLLIISLNPKLDRTAPVITEFDEYLEAHLDQNRIRARDPYVDAVREILPTGFTWGKVGTGSVANTRAYKCPTDTAGHRAAARLCTSKFLAAELALLQPRLVLSMGADAWHFVLPYLGLSRPRGPGPHLLEGALAGRPIPVVACYHLSGQHRLGHTPEYRRAVRDALEQAARASKSRTEPS